MPAELFERLRSSVQGEVRSDDYTRHLFARDASMYSIVPAGVVFPRCVDDIVATVALANEFGVSITARGAGTSLAGQTVGDGIILDVSRHLNKIIAIDPTRNTALVEGGVVQDDLNDAAAEFGLMFGPDTSTSNRATLAGMIGNNSAGSGSVQYGMTIDHVRALDVVLADGTVTRLEAVDEQQRLERASRPSIEGAIYRDLHRLVAAHGDAIARGLPQFWRRAGGYRLERLFDGDRYDLAKFVVGSEGTLALLTSAEVALVHRPTHSGFLVGHFASVAGAIAATGDALTMAPAQVELIDRTILDLSRSNVEYAGLGQILVGDPDALLFVSFTSDDLDEVHERMDALSAIWREHGHGYHTLKATSARDRDALLKVRKSALGLLMASSEGSRRPLAFVEDTAVPPAVLPEYVARFTEVLRRHQLQAGFYGHCSVGCLHIRPFVDLRDPAEVIKMREVAIEIKDLVAEFGGANSSEHGDGLARSEFNREIFGDELYDVMREVKRIFDPAGRLNPGKIVDAPSMVDHLRDPSLAVPVSFVSKIAFAEHDAGMRDLADRCMNIGLCRKTTAGVMCPSYAVTLDEEQSTRGRANALLLAMSADDPAAALGNDRLHEILDNCLMCKACKTECPMGVDVAAMKSEALAQRYEVNGTPRRLFVWRRIRTLNRLGSMMAPFSNTFARQRWVRSIGERALGISARRPLPHFHRTHLLKWFRARPAVTATDEILLLADSFTTYTEPAVGQAAVELLELAGYRVRLIGSGCCGRASFSKGLVDDAARKAGALVDLLSTSSAPIVGCEPSCLFTLRDEHLRLLPNDDRVQSVGSRVMEIESVIASAIADGRLRLREQHAMTGRRIVYHGHCHQKAEVGTQATVSLLRLIPGVEVVELDVGCCGMAGSFGFEAEHYDTSVAIAELRLVPAIRATGLSDLVVASGVSCRQQISHCTGRIARHPLLAVLDAVHR